MIKVERHKIKKSNKYYRIFEEMCKETNSLYNRGMYIVRQNFFKNKTVDKTGKEVRKYIGYQGINKILKEEENKHYCGLPRQSSQQTLRTLDKNWKSFFRSIKDWKVHPEKYLGMPKPPKYKKKGGLNVVIFTNQQCKIVDGEVRFPKACGGYRISLYKKDIRKLNQVRIIPKLNSLIAEVVYGEKVMKEKKADNGRYIGIDIGLDNLITIASTCSQSVLIDGKGLKSRNKWYNEEISRLKSLLPKGENGKQQGSSKRIQRIYEKRREVISDYMHKASRYVVNYCKENDISRVVIGHNKRQKQELKLKHFVNIPVFSIIEKLRYKLLEEGIELEEVDESYTSGTSFIDGEIPKKENYKKERRIKRGLFKTNEGQLINADVNGAYQILRKAISNVEKPVDKGFVFNPIRLKV